MSKQTSSRVQVFYHFNKRMEKNLNQFVAEIVRCQLSTVQFDHYGIDCYQMHTCVCICAHGLYNFTILHFYIFTIPHFHFSTFFHFLFFSIRLCIRFHRSRSSVTTNYCGRRRDATLKIIDVIMSINCF